MALGPTFPVITAWAPRSTAIWAVRIPAPPAASILGLGRHSLPRSPRQLLPGIGSAQTLVNGAGRVTFRGRDGQFHFFRHLLSLHKRVGNAISSFRRTCGFRTWGNSWSGRVCHGHAARCTRNSGIYRTCFPGPLVCPRVSRLRLFRIPASITPPFLQ